jgi:hypothetical protein
MCTETAIRAGMADAVLAAIDSLRTTWARHRDLVGEIHAHPDIGFGRHERFVEL